MHEHTEHTHHKAHTEKLWFKAKRYGWGWTPVSWEGWGVVIVYIALMVWLISLIDVRHHSLSDTLVNFSIRFLVLTLVFMGICYIKSEDHIGK